MVDAVPIYYTSSNSKNQENENKLLFALTIIEIM